MNTFKRIFPRAPVEAKATSTTEQIKEAIEQLEQRSKQYTVAWVPNDFMEYFERVAANRGCLASDVFLEAMHEHLMRHKEEAKLPKERRSSE